VTARRGTEIAQGFWFADYVAPELVLQLQRAPTVIVHVVDSATGKPIAGAALWAGYTSDAQPSAVTDANGVAHLALEELAVRGRALGFTRKGHGFPLPIGVEAPGYPSVDAELDLGSTDTVEQTVRLTRGIAVSGRVVDPTGRPVAGARVIVEDPRDVETRTTDATGGFAVAVPGPGRYRARAVPADRARRNAEPAVDLDVGADGRADVVVPWREQPADMLTGIVVDANGRPVAGARVAATEPFSVIRPVATDARGAFEIPRASIRLFREEAHLVARLGDLASELVPIRERDLPTSLTFQLGAAGITGVVVDLDGAPIAHADVYLNPSTFHGGHVETDDNGRFELDVPRGSFRLSVRHSTDDDFDDRDDRIVAGGSRDIRLTVP